MGNSAAATGHFTARVNLDECLLRLGVNPGDPAALPFAPGDTTGGVENELQVAVLGSREAVDLPVGIESSNYFANVLRRARVGDASPRLGRNLERYLADNPEEVWENSWVRLPLSRLGRYASEILHGDLRADKNLPDSPPRRDRERFFLTRQGEEWLRVPISYLLKLALADLIADNAALCPQSQATGRRLLGHFLNDNTSPETFSFHVVSHRPAEGLGRKLARETARRFLLSHLLLLYANRKFSLEENGQQALIFFSPHPPVRQRQLNEGISDAFYRELFMSPCLAGWNDGESKHRYMALCHQVLSRSHLNGVMKLREAGIITSNLVVLPHTSNIGLANNGTHVSLGSRKLGGLLANPASGFGPAHEKYLGDLAAKLIEHFLPLFVGTYSAAPYRLAFEDFHPEQVLGFLAHELDYTHLRMLWRRWKKKARNRLAGHRLTPFGPPAFDRLIGRLFGLKGDFVPDFRLLDYPVALLSTESNCGQDGVLGNEARLKADLEALGVFDRSMSVYQLIRLRTQAAMGFSGFEARYYSLFENFEQDLGQAADFQMLLNCLAFKYMLSHRLSHRHIPGTPLVESERRQIFFGAAIGLPTFFVRKESDNVFLRSILARTPGIRASRRYPGYLRVRQRDYRLALLAMIREDGADLIEMFGCHELLADLEQRLREPETAAVGRLVRGIMGEARPGRRSADPLSLTAHEFNQAAEGYYRNALRQRHLAEALAYLREEVAAMTDGRHPLPLESRQAVAAIRGGEGLEERLAADPSLPEIVRLAHLLLLAEDWDAKKERAAAG